MGAEGYYFFHLSHALCVAKGKKREGEGTRECGLEGLVGAACSMFLSGSCLMHGEGEEAKIGIVVALSLVAERATIEHEPIVSERVEGKVTR